MKTLRENKGGVKILIAILVIIIGAGGALGYKIVKDKENQETTVTAEENNETQEPVEEKRYKYFKALTDQ